MKPTAATRTPSPLSNTHGSPDAVNSAPGQGESSSPANVSTLSPKAQIHLRDFQSMLRCWSEFEQPPKAAQHQMRSPSLNLQEAASLGHVGANKLLSQRALQNQPISHQAAMESMQYARRALEGICATEATNQLALSVGGDQVELLGSHYCKLMNAPEFKSLALSPKSAGAWTPQSTQITALDAKIQRSLVALQAGQLVWNPNMAADVDRLANGFIALGRSAEAAHLYQNVLNAIPSTPTAWMK